MSIVFLTGFGSWWTQNPKYIRVGHAHGESCNPDPVTRCFWHGFSDWNGDGWIWRGPHNLGLHLAGLMLGPPKGAYTGPYPTREEALAALALGEPVPLLAFSRDQVVLSGKSIALDAGIGIQLLKNTLELSPSAWERESPGREPACRITAVLYQDDCLILRMRSQMHGLMDIVVLLDRKIGRPFACYVLASPFSPYLSPYHRRAPAGNKGG